MIDPKVMESQHNDSVMMNNERKKFLIYETLMEKYREYSSKICVCYRFSFFFHLYSVVNVCHYTKKTEKLKVLIYKEREREKKMFFMNKKKRKPYGKPIHSLNDCNFFFFLLVNGKKIVKKTHKN